MLNIESGFCDTGDSQIDQKQTGSLLLKINKTADGKECEVRYKY